MLLAVGYLVEYVVVNVVEYVLGFLASSWLLSGCVQVAFWLLSGCLPFAVAFVALRMLVAVAAILTLRRSRHSK